MGEFSRTCPVCGEIMIYANKQSLNRSIKENIKCLSCRKKETEERNSVGEFIRYCPSCNKKLSYSTKYGLIHAINKNCICDECAKKLRHPKTDAEKEGIYIRICPDCNENIFYETRRSLNKAIKLNSICKTCASKIRKPAPVGPFTRICSQCGIEIVYSCKGSLTIATKKDSKCKKCGNINSSKKRLAYIEVMRNKHGQISPNYNPIGCKTFENIMQMSGVYIQHAENGGEYRIKELGYWVDGYDAENNIVYEYDEKHHFYKGKLKEKDIIRQKNIEDFLKCKFIRIKEPSILILKHAHS